MLEQTLQVLEFTKVVELLCRFTVTAPGRELTAALRPLRQRREVAAVLEYVGEAQTLLEEKGAPPLGGSCELGDILEQAAVAGAWLSAAALLQVADSLDAARDCRNWFGSEELSPRLARLVEQLQLLPQLRDHIRHCIAPGGEINDNASWQLADLRSQEKTLRARIRRALERMLTSAALDGVFQDDIVTERNGRYVVPVRADHRGSVKGLVHDESSSGQTLFVEPEQVLEHNNELQAVVREQQREIERILLQLAAQVGAQRDALAANQKLLARLDMYSAVARFARLTGGCAPQLTDKRQLELVQARHPLLLLNSDGSRREQAAVPVDLRLGKKHDTLIISGPNTGGKTVALKTVGLLFLMVSAGVPIPCASGSRVYLFKKIFADIGDEQSIEENLSTFSGHLARIRKILRWADGDSLVLLDEAGTGTDPAEGGALALAVLDRLRAVGARTVVTTHLNMIKSYACLHQRVENAAVEFDERTLRPTYRLHYGVPGASSAFTIARAMGIPDKVLNSAEAYLGSRERDGLEMVEQLNRLRTATERELEQARALKAQAQAEREKRRRLLAEIEDKRQRMLDKARGRAEQMVHDTRVRMRELLKQARAHGGDSRAEAEMMSQVRQLGEELAPQPLAPRRHRAAPQQVTAGELVRVVALNVEATVRRCHSGQVELECQGKIMRLALAAVEAYQPRRFAAAAGVGATSKSTVAAQRFNPRLEVVGMRVEQALPLVERLIDDALLNDWRELSVVHGRGSGILRREIRQCLAQHRAVSAFYSADNASGGDGVTVIEVGD